jgi:hypothetical protein
MSDPTKQRVTRLYNTYDKAQHKLDSFRASHEEVFEKFVQLANERNVALDQVKRAVRETGVEVGMMEVSISHKRIIDGEYLYKRFKNRKDLRQAVVKLKFEVDTKGFDHLVQAGEIDAATAQRAVLEIKESNRVLHAPNEIVVD